EGNLGDFRHLSLEQRVGAGALLALGRDLGAGARDLFLELADISLELRDRERRQILLGGLFLAREQILLVHRHSPRSLGCCRSAAQGLEVQSISPTMTDGLMTALPATMTAIEITEPGGPEALKPVSRPLPLPGAGEVLIQVAAAGVNRPDVMQRQGSYPPPPGASDIPGLEIAGKVVAVGLGVNHTKIGDAVCALVTGGGYATYCFAPEPQCLPVPKGFSMVEAAALPETFFTVWTNLFERGALKPGETVLIHGGTSGIGTTAIQLAKALGAHQVFATAGSRDKCHASEKLGATRGIDYKHEDFVKIVKDMTAGRGGEVHP